MLRTLLVGGLIAVLASTGSAQWLENGSFNDWNTTYSTDDIPNWTVDSDEPFAHQSGIYFTLSEISAIDGAMVLLTTDPNPGIFGMTDVTKLISDPFLVTGEKKTIEFNYIYITGQTEAEAAAGHIDPFEVAVVRASDGIPLYLETMATAADDLVHSTVDYGPLPGPNNRQTEGSWIHHHFSLLPFAGETVNLVFTISDAPGSLVNSGVVIDEVEQTPEPATLALFGLGLAGLGLAVRARRRRRAA
jgi:hypothetical protein